MEFFKKPIYKSRTDKKIDGVCAGVAKAFGVDPSWVRLLFAGLLVFGGSGLLFYIILDIVLDKEPEEYIE